MTTHAFGLERIGLLCIRAPRLAVIVMAAISALAAYGFVQVDYDDDLRNLLRSDREIPQRYERFLEKFPALENQTFLLVEGDRLIERDSLEAVRNLHLDLQFVDGVTNVLSMFTARHKPDADGNLKPVFPEVLPDGNELKQLVEAARTHPLLADKMLSADGTATLLVVEMAADVKDYGRYVSFFGEMDEVIQDTVGDLPLRVTATGEPALRYEILNIIRSDMRVLNLTGGAIAIFVCALFFRRVILIFLASFTPVVGVIWTLGAFGLAGVKITAMSNILPTLVLVIGFSDSLHMVFSMRRLLMEGKTPREAAETSVREVGPACAMTTVTTAIALGALAFSESAVIQQFGIGGVFGVFVAFIAVVAFVPALAVLLLPYMKVRPAGTEHSAITRLSAGGSRRMWALVEKSPTGVVLAGVVMLVMTGTAYFKLEPAYDYREYLSPQSEANQAIDRINEKMGGADITFVMIERSGNQAQARSAEVIEAVHNVVAAQPDIENVTSLASVRAWLDKPADPERGDNSDILDELPEHYANRLASPDRTAWLISGYVPAAPAPETQARFDRLDRDLDTLRNRYPGYDINKTGVIVLAAYESSWMIEGLKQSMTWAIFAIVIIIGITARSFLLAGLSVVPNLLSLSVVAAALFLLGFGFQFTSAVALTVAFGIAVDNTVHFLHRFQLQREARDTRDALAETMVKVGPVLIAATAVLMLGIGVTQLSVLPMVELFGRLCIVVLCSALLATMMLLPALILTASARIRGL